MRRPSSWKNRFKAPVKRKAAGAPPGSLIFTGQQHGETTQVTLVQYNAEAYSSTHATDAVPAADPGEGVMWYDVRSVHNVALIEAMGRQFNVHPLVLEDVLDVHQRPKFEEYDEGLFIVLRAFRFDPDQRCLITEQVALYVKHDVVLSFQEDVDDLFLPVRQRLEAGRGKIRRRGADYLAYALMDNIVDYYFHLLDRLEEELDKTEVEIMRNASDRTKDNIHQLKLNALTLRRAVGPLRDAVNRFAQSEHALVQEETRLFIRDLHDHTIQVMDLVETYRDIINGLYDLYVSEISFKMNNVMQLLTVISTIFIPLTFLVGVYGMNFEFMPELRYKYGYLLVWVIMMAVAGVMVYYFRRKGWLQNLRMSGKNGNGQGSKGNGE